MFFMRNTAYAVCTDDNDDSDGRSDKITGGTNYKRVKPFSVLIILFSEHIALFCTTF